MISSIQIRPTVESDIGNEAVERTSSHNPPSPTLNQTTGPISRLVENHLTRYINARALEHDVVPTNSFPLGAFAHLCRINTKNRCKYQLDSATIPPTYQHSPSMDHSPSVPPTSKASKGTPPLSPRADQQSPTRIDSNSTPHVPEESYDSPNEGDAMMERPVNQKGRTARWTPFVTSLNERWDAAVRTRLRLPRIIYALLGIIFVAVWIGIAASFTSREKDYQRQIVRGGIRPITDIFSGIKLWALEGRLTRLDTNMRTLSISWGLRYINNGRAVPFGEDTKNTFSVGIFRDQRLTLANDTAPWEFTPNDVPNTYTFQVINKTAVPIAIVGLNPWDSFSTDIEMDQEVEAMPLTTPDFGFPFDLWSGSTTFVANYYDFARFRNSSTAAATQIDDAYLVGSIMNWRVTIDVNNTCTSYSDGSVSWVATGPCGLTLTFNARRPGLVKFACIVAVLVNWLSTISIFVMTCEGVVMRRSQVIMAPSLLGVCFTALFALPTVRSILPGAPAFGALIDLVGIIPNVIIISLCTTVVAIANLRHLVEERQQVDLEVDTETQRKKLY
ncbi:hypothetical protein CPB86DRAFT_744380 [Serendipita vermifera]|nr:hypothetical protein CPB86DRAFT_744380 [Serendipita vermifera]